MPLVENLLQNLSHSSGCSPVGNDAAIGDHLQYHISGDSKSFLNLTPLVVLTVSSSWSWRRARHVGPALPPQLNTTPSYQMKRALMSYLIFVTGLIFFPGVIAKIFWPCGEFSEILQKRFHFSGKITNMRCALCCKQRTPIETQMPSEAKVPSLHTHCSALLVERSKAQFVHGTGMIHVYEAWGRPGCRRHCDKLNPLARKVGNRRQLLAPALKLG